MRTEGKEELQAVQLLSTQTPFLSSTKLRQSGRLQRVLENA